MTKKVRPNRANAWERFWGDAPKVNKEHMITTHHEKGIHKMQITLKIDAIRDGCKSKPFKIGKTGNPHERVMYKDYFDTYTTMYVLYQSLYPEVISELERHFISKYYRKTKNENIEKSGTGKMYSPDGYFFLYLVI